MDLSISDTHRHVVLGERPAVKPEILDILREFVEHDCALF